MKIKSLLPLLALVGLLFVSVNQKAEAYSGLDYPQIAQLPSGSVTAASKMLMQCTTGPYCFQKFTVDSLTAYFMQRALEFQRSAIFDSNVTIAGVAKAAYVAVETDTSGQVVALDSMLTGAATNPNDTVRCVKIGYLRSCRQVGGISATSNGAAFTFGPLPVGYRPIGTAVVDIARVTDNGVVRHGLGSIATTGVVTVLKTDTAGVYSATFTSSGTKAIGAGTILTFLAW